MTRRREPSLGRCGAAENQGASPSRSKGWTAASGAPATPLSPAARAAQRARPPGELTLCVP